MYKRGVLQQLFDNLSVTEKIPLSNICTISTGKLDANKSTIKGKYPFFTCSKETLRINSYSFDGEAILIAGNGDIGHTKYYKGKFDAYQRTYVLMNSIFDMGYLKSAIDLFLPNKIHEETQGGAMPYIKLSTLNTLQIPKVDEKSQHKISDITSRLTNKIELSEKELTILETLKNGLLQQMFI